MPAPSGKTAIVGSLSSRLSSEAAPHKRGKIVLSIAALQLLLSKGGLST